MQLRVFSCKWDVYNEIHPFNIVVTRVKSSLVTVENLNSNMMVFGDRIVKMHEDEKLWIASRLIWFDQPRPPDSSQTAPVKIGPSS
ncbi:hypothetical protein STEG23_023328 [Scotinomys teguina]